MKFFSDSIEKLRNVQAPKWLWNRIFYVMNILLMIFFIKEYYEYKLSWFFIMLYGLFAAAIIHWQAWLWCLFCLIIGIFLKSWRISLLLTFATVIIWLWTWNLIGMRNF